MKKLFSKFLGLGIALALTLSVSGIGAYAKEEYKISSRFLELILDGETLAPQCDTCLLGNKNNDANRPVLTVGGSIFGIKIDGEGVEVSSVSDAASTLKVGDKIIKVNGVDIKTPSDLKAQLSQGKDKYVLSVKRLGKLCTVTVSPTADGSFGITVKDGAQGIGTITFYDANTGLFAGLGHGICDQDSGKCIAFDSAAVVGAKLVGIQKPSGKDPGELKGVLTSTTLGQLYGNTDCGVFGKLDTAPSTLVSEPMPIAYKNEVKEGAATILSTVRAGDIKEYTINIIDIDVSENGSKCFKIEITDPALLALSGGIVRGMSGSPIIQNGRLVGAVTHVLVANPTEGYGIFIENMLNAANQKTNPKAA